MSKVLEVAYNHYIYINSHVDNKVYYNFLDTSIKNTSEGRSFLSLFPEIEDTYIFGFQSPYIEGSTFFKKDEQVERVKGVLLTSESVYIRLCDGRIFKENLSMIVAKTMEELALMIALGGGEAGWLDGDNCILDCFEDLRLAALSE